MFSKRHYHAIASELKAQRPGEHWDANKRVQWDLIVRALADRFARESASFRRDQFIAACGGLFNV